VGFTGYKQKAGFLLKLLTGPGFSFALFYIPDGRCMLPLNFNAQNERKRVRVL
jgi:hypothetical protein